MIEVKGLTKRYGNHTAVDNLSFSIGEGQIYGFLGPNGAGKSTTMNIMTGCLAATSGEVKIGGFDIFEDAAKAKKLIGYLPEQPPLYLDRTPREYLDFVARAKGLSGSERKTQIERVMTVTGITEVGNRLIKNLSKGYKQRVGIAQALLGDPKVIILDEPTVGLDPRQIIEIRELIAKLGQNHTVILSSHILSEVQAVCHTILILSHGKLVACDTPKNLEKLFAGSTSVEVTAEADETACRKILSEISGISELSFTETSAKRSSFRISTDRDETVCRDIFLAFSRSVVPLLRLTPTKVSLEDIFIELTSDKAETDKDPAALPEAPEQSADKDSGFENKEGTEA